MIRRFFLLSLIAFSHRTTPKCASPSITHCASPHRQTPERDAMSNSLAAGKQKGRDQIIGRTDGRGRTEAPRRRPIPPPARPLTHSLNHPIGCSAWANTSMWGGRGCGPPGRLRSHDIRISLTYYRARKNGLQNVLSTTQAGSGRLV